jgi:acylphosphatase
MACVKFVVSGRVQGVFFRASTSEEALRLGLTGHARNLPDGTVEVVACGDDAALADLERWLELGPPLAQVSRVERSTADIAVPARFSIA